MNQNNCRAGSAPPPVPPRTKRRTRRSRDSITNSCVATSTSASRNVRLLKIYGRTHDELSRSRAERVAGICAGLGGGTVDVPLQQVTNHRRGTVSANPKSTGVTACMADAQVSPESTPPFRFSHRLESERIAASRAAQRNTLRQLHDASSRTAKQMFPKSSQSIVDLPRPAVSMASSSPASAPAGDRTAARRASDARAAATAAVLLTRSSARARSAAQRSQEATALLQWLTSRKIGHLFDALHGECSVAGLDTLLEMNERNLALVLRRLVHSGASPSDARILRRSVVRGRLRGTFAIDAGTSASPARSRGRRGSVTGAGIEPDPSLAEQAALLIACGMVFDAGGAQNAALERLQRALKLQRRLASAARPALIAVTLHMIGMVHEEQSRNQAANQEGAGEQQSQATSYFSQARAARRKLQSADEVYSMISACLHALGCVLDAGADHALALQHLQQAIDTKTAQSRAASRSRSRTPSSDKSTQDTTQADCLSAAPEHRSSTNLSPSTMCELCVFEAVYGLVSHKLGQDTETTITHLSRATSMCDRMVVRELMHALVATCCHARGVLEAERGNWTAAEKMLKESLGIKRHMHGADAIHSVVASLLDVVVLVLDQTGDYAEKSPKTPFLFEGVLWYLEGLIVAAGRAPAAEAMPKGNFAAHDHADAIPTVMALASVQLSKTTPDLWSALALYEEALRLVRVFYGIGARPDAALALQRIGSTRDTLGQHDGAIAAVNEALSMQRELYGNNALRPDIAHSLHQLGSAYGAQRQHDTSCSYLEEALATYRRMSSVGRFIRRLGDKVANKVCSSNESAANDSATGQAGGATAVDMSLRFERMQRDIVLSTAIALHVLGMVQHDRGPAWYDDSLASLMESIRIKRQLQRDIDAEAAAVAASEGDGEATATVSNGTEFCSIRLAGESMTVATELSMGLHQLGLLHRSRGDHSNALRCFEESLDIDMGMSNSVPTKVSPCKSTSDTNAPPFSLECATRIAASTHLVGVESQALGRIDDAILRYEAALTMQLRLDEQLHNEQLDAVDGHSSFTHACESYCGSGDISQPAVDLNSFNGPALPTDHAIEICTLWKDHHWKGRTMHAYSRQREHMRQQSCTLHALGAALLQLSPPQPRRALPHLSRSLELKRKLLPISEHDGVKEDENGSTDVNFVDSIERSSCVSVDAERDADMGRLLQQLGTANAMIGDTDASLSFLHQALILQEKLNSSPSATGTQPLVNTLHAIGQVMQQIGDFDSALHYLQRVLRMKQDLERQRQEKQQKQQSSAVPPVNTIDAGLDSSSVTGHAHTTSASIAATLHELGMVHGNRGDTDAALRCLSESLAMDWALHGHDAVRADIAATLYQLGILYNIKGDKVLALRYCQQSLGMDQKLHGDGVDHPDVASALHNAGLLLNATGDYEQGVRHLQQALEMKRRLYAASNADTDAGRQVGDEHPCIAATDRALATIMLDKASLHDGQRSPNKAARPTPRRRKRWWQRH